jgi:predicted RNA-binding Zn ribbon-like protein
MFISGFRYMEAHGIIAGRRSRRVGAGGHGESETLDEPSMTDAGHPALVFLNSVADSGKSRDLNTFSNGSELLQQLRAGGIDVRQDPPATGQLRDLIHLREAAYGVLSAIAAGRKALHEDALALETRLKDVIADAAFAPGARGLPFHPGPMGGLHDILALSILDLLQSDDLARLRECRRCTRLFIDRGRGPGRRWCSMARCGNRSKAEGFRERHRGRMRTAGGPVRQ